MSLAMEIVEVPISDEAAVLDHIALHNAAAGPDLSFAPAAALHWLRSMPDAICLLARIDGAPAGAAAGFHDDTVKALRLGVMDLAVTREHRRRGIGEALLERVLRWARRADLDALATWTLEADAATVGFLSRRDFAPGMRDQKLALDVAAAPELPVDPPPGIALVTLAERPDLEEGAFAVAREAWPDIPAPEPMIPESFARWRELEIGHPGTSPERVTLALAGGVVVGYGILVDGSRPGSQYSEITGVLRAWRGRGVGSAIKRSQLAWAKSSGVSTLITDNDTGNAAMLAINRRLGYAELPITVAMRRVLRVREAAPDAPAPPSHPSPR